MLKSKKVLFFCQLDSKFKPGEKLYLLERYAALILILKNAPK
jgi:hypothetical protein